MQKYRKHLTKKGRIVRSGLEAKILNQLDGLKIKYEYEPKKLLWEDKIQGGKCIECGSKKIYKQRTYLPDIILGTGVVIEAKGKFTSRDRKIVKAIRAKYPELDYRIVFDKDNRLSKGSGTRYSEWCLDNGVPCSFKGVIPTQWLEELRKVPGISK